MKQLNAKTIGIGALAGFTATLLVLGSAAQPSFSAFLYAASAMPILIVGLGWGNVAAISAIVTSAVIGAIVISPLFALLTLLSTLLPAGWLSHLANLGRPASELGGPDNLTAWYPLSDIMLHLCALVSIAVIVGGIALGYGPELIDRAVDLLMETVKQQDSNFSPDPDATAQTKSLMLILLPIMQAAIWVILLFTVYYISTRIVTASGRNFRPREDIPSTLRMNRNAIFVLLASLICCFLGGTIALIGATVFGAFSAGFLLSGFASIHFRTRGKDWRVPALILCYLSVLLTLPALFILAVGLADTRKAIALSPNRDAKTQEQNR